MWEQNSANRTLVLAALAVSIVAGHCAAQDEVYFWRPDSGVAIYSRTTLYWDPLTEEDDGFIEDDVLVAQHGSGTTTEVGPAAGVNWGLSGPPGYCDTAAQIGFAPSGQALGGFSLICTKDLAIAPVGPVFPRSAAAAAFVDYALHSGWELASETLPNGTETGAEIELEVTWNGTDDADVSLYRGIEFEFWGWGALGEFFTVSTGDYINVEYFDLGEYLEESSNDSVRSPLGIYNVTARTNISVGEGIGGGGGTPNDAAGQLHGEITDDGIDGDGIDASVIEPDDEVLGGDIYTVEFEVRAGLPPWDMPDP